MSSKSFPENKRGQACAHSKSDRSIAARHIVMRDDQEAALPHERGSHTAFLENGEGLPVDLILAGILPACRVPAHSRAIPLSSARRPSLRRRRSGDFAGA